MNPKISEYYFDLSNFQFSSIFENKQYVWEILGDELKAFIKNNISKKILAKVEKGAFLSSDDIFIDEGTVVEAGAYIKGPAIIGKNCEIRSGAYIRGNVLVGDSCVIGHTTEIKGSIMLNNAKAGHFAYIGDSILGNNVNLGAGVKLANLKVIKGNVNVKIDKERIDSGLRKFGGILGDNTELGCNSVTSPGTLIGKNCACYPCSHLHGFYKSNSIIRLKQNLEIN